MTQGDKTLALTGATGTLGGAVEAYFVDCGWTVRGCSLHGSREADFQAVDVLDERSVVDWFRECAPAVDAAVTCAGVSLVKPTLSMSLDEWFDVVAVNLDGTFLAVREAVKRGATRIVTVGSIHGCTPTSYPQRAPYTASKAGVAGLTRALAVELAADGVAVNCVAPGHLPALMDGTGAGQALLDAVAQRTPSKRLTTPEEVAGVIYWLCNDAPLNLTGQVITVDGGFTIDTFPMR